MKDQFAEEVAALEATVPKEVFKAEVAAWAKRIGATPKELHVRPMAWKWGSCSTAGRVTFDAGLLHPAGGLPPRRSSSTNYCTSKCQTTVDYSRHCCGPIWENTIRQKASRTSRPARFEYGLCGPAGSAAYSSKR